MHKPAVDTTIREMPQVAELVGNDVIVTCRIGAQPLYRYRFALAALPTDASARRAYLRSLAENALPSFFSSYGELANRCLTSQDAAIQKLRFKETG